MKKPFDRILIVMFENQYRSYVIQHPFMQKLATAGAELTNFFGAFHPSQTNYIASLAGEVCAVTNDTAPASPLPQQTLVDLLEAKNVSWKAYMEAYPGDSWKPEWKNSDYPASDQPIAEFPDNGYDLARYYRKHNAFGSFHSIQKDKNRWEKIVSENVFWQDIVDKGQNLPEYSWFTPDIWNDGHYLFNTHVDTNPRTLLISQMSGWLETVFFSDIAANKVQGASEAKVANLGLNLDIDLLLTNPARAWKASRVPERTLIVITFDEADFDAKGFDTNYDGPNQVYTVVLGDMIDPGTVITNPLNHYSLIKTIEQNFKLGSLGKNDHDANWFRFLWDEKFAWSKPDVTDMTAKGELVAAHLNQNVFIVFDEGGGNLVASESRDGTWSDPLPIRIKTSGSLAMATLNQLLYLVFADDNGQLFYTTSESCGAWSEPCELQASTNGNIAMTSYWDAAESEQKLMLCFVGKSGFIKYLIHERGGWTTDTREVGQLTDGPMALSQLGHSLYLVYKERNTRHMRMTSFNLAPFNAFKAVAFDGCPAPLDDTSLHRWSPFDMHVGHFSKKMGAQQNNYQALGNFAMASIKGEMHLVNRGGYEDTFEAYTEIFGLTGIFTAVNQETNGFGTIDQAGWTIEAPLPGVTLNPESGISIASNGHQMTLVWQDKTNNKIEYLTGSYSACV